MDSCTSPNVGRAAMPAGGVGVLGAVGRTVAAVTNMSSIFCSTLARTALKESYSAKGVPLQYLSKAFLDEPSIIW